MAHGLPAASALRGPPPTVWRLGPVFVVNAVLVPLANAMQMLGIYVERGVEFIINLIKLRSVSQAQAANQLPNSRASS